MQVRGATGTSVDFTQYDACQLTDLKAQYISLDFKNIKLVPW